MQKAQERKMTGFVSKLYQTEETKSTTRNQIPRQYDYRIRVDGGVLVDRERSRISSDTNLVKIIQFEPVYYNSCFEFPRNYPSKWNLYRYRLLIYNYTYIGPTVKV